MVVSSAFAEFSELVRKLEESGTEIREITLRGDTSETADELTAVLSVRLPFIRDASLRDDVSITAADFDTDGQCLTTDLEISVPIDEAAETDPLDGAVSPNDGRHPTERKESELAPKYKDPDALETVYERYDSFPEMTEALGVDVTPETVRRHMVKYDIHDPHDSGPASHSTTSSLPNAATDGGHESSRGGGDSRSDPSGTDDREEINQGDRPAVESISADDQGRSDGTNSPEVPIGESGQTQTNTRSMIDETGDGLGDQSVAELLAEGDAEREDRLVTDGLGMTEELTVGRLTDVINSSKTVHEVQQRLDLNESSARRFLREFDLIDLVSHRLASDQITVSHAEIVRRIESET